MRYAKHSIMKRNQNTLLIDSSNLLHRAVWIAESVPRNVNPSYIFLTSVKKYAEMYNTNHIYSIWDKRLIRGVKNYRRLAKKVEYKGNRDSEKNARVFSHEDKTTELLNMLGVRNMYPGILEADDVIAWLTKKIPGNKIVVSVDQDMLQLIDKKTKVYSPIKDVLIDHVNFEEKVGVTMDQFLRYKSLMGDKSDNLPGVERCGPKTAKKLVNECVTDDQLIEKLGEQALKPYFENLDLIDLTKGHQHHPGDVEIYDKQYSELQNQAPDIDKFRKTCENLNINKIVDNISTWSELFTGVSLNNTLESIVNSLGLSK